MTAAIQDHVEHFWSRVYFDTVENGCWLWTGASAGKYGHGSYPIRGRLTYAHRYAWELTFGPIPAGPGYHGMCVLHRCDCPGCVRPEHLFLGTQTDNIRDRHKKGRSRGPSGEAHGLSRLTATQVLQIRSGRGSRAASELAREFGIHVSTVRSVWARHTWAWLEAE